jgi:uncharacterized protein
MVDGLREYVPADDPIVLAATVAVQAGDLSRLDELLESNPWLATAKFGDRECHCSLLHAATDWPGHFPSVGESIARIVRAGADVSAPSRFDAHQETPLHWAASSNDVIALDALLDAGADIEATGAVLGGGTALADACGFGNDAAARRLVNRGARTRLQDAAALGLMDRVEAAFAGEPGPDTTSVTQALWSACSAGQAEAAVYLAERGADVNWIGWDGRTPLDVAERAGAGPLVQWLLAYGAARR